MPQTVQPFPKVEKGSHRLLVVLCVYALYIIHCDNFLGTIDDIGDGRKCHSPNKERGYNKNNTQDVVACHRSSLCFLTNFTIFTNFPTFKKRVTCCCATCQEVF